MWAWKADVYGRAGHPDEARLALAKLEQSSGSAANRAATLLIGLFGHRPERAGARAAPTNVCGAFERGRADQSGPDVRPAAQRSPVQGSAAAPWIGTIGTGQ